MPRPLPDDPPLPGPGPGPSPNGPDPKPENPLTGPIAARWRKLGAEKWGRYDAESGVMNLGGGGQWAQFFMKDGSLRTIAWSSATGAQVVTTLFSGEWVRRGRNGGFLGFPTSDEVITHDGVGRFQMFQGGWLVRHPETAAHEVHGAIQARYADLGGSRWGYPTSDETDVGDGRGRFNHFYDPSTGAHRSLYWTQKTGVRAVQGFITTHWEQLGGPRGLLGHPTSDETAAHAEPGRFATFEGGLIAWHPETGAHEVHGAILERYLERGGTRWGYPTSDEMAMPDKRGRVNHFFDVATHGEKSIYWSPQSGAHGTQGYIRRAWMQYKGHAALGYPTGEEEVADTGGRQQDFEHATYLWHPNIGAFEVHGKLRERWRKLGGPAWGYPTTDEAKTADGRGRLNHFHRITTNESLSIYWSKKTNAREVLGYIRHRWIEMGAERSYLGYPTGPEVDWTAGGSGAKEQPFEGGRMLYSPTAGGAAPDPIRFNKGVRSKGLAAFGADVNLQLSYDGGVKLFGHVSTDGEGYNWAINAMVRTANSGVAIRTSGHIPGKVPEIGKRNYRHWEVTDSRPAIRNHFFELQRATLEVAENHDGDWTGVIDNVLATLLSWGAGAALGPGGFLLIYAGTELTGLIANKGDWNAGLRIAQGTVWMMLPGGYLIVLLEPLAALGERHRAMTEPERTMADLVFKTSLRYQDILLTDTAVVKGTAFALPAAASTQIMLNLGDGYRDPSDLGDRAWRKFFIHELVHAWQWQHMGSGNEFVLHGTAARFEELIRGKHKTYDPGDIGKDWDSYNIEQQARIVEEWFDDHYRNDPANEHNLASANALNDKRFDHIAGHIRVGKA